MPPRNPPRTLYSEGSLARRIAFERGRNGWSYEGLASRLTAAGCPIRASALYKIEKSDPPRRITVAELVAFAQVFEVSVEEMLVDPESALSRETRALLEEFWKAADEASRRYAALRVLTKDHPEQAAEVETRLAEWLREAREEVPPEFRTDPVTRLVEHARRQLLARQLSTAVEVWAYPRRIEERDAQVAALGQRLAELERNGDRALAMVRAVAEQLGDGGEGAVRALQYVAWGRHVLDERDARLAALVETNAAACGHALTRQEIARLDHQVVAQLQDELTALVNPAMGLDLDRLRRAWAQMWDLYAMILNPHDIDSVTTAEREWIARVISEQGNLSDPLFATLDAALVQQQGVTLATSARTAPDPTSSLDSPG